MKIPVPLGKLARMVGTDVVVGLLQDISEYIKNHMISKSGALCCPPYRKTAFADELDRRVDKTDESGNITVSIDIIQSRRVTSVLGEMLREMTPEQQIAQLRELTS